eukprot:762874-Hanusia_phi.AAC.2
MNKQGKASWLRARQQARGIMLSLLVATVQTGPLPASAARLLGGALSWSLDPSFREGSRIVSFALRSAWGNSTGCGGASSSACDWGRVYVRTCFDEACDSYAEEKYVNDLTLLSEMNGTWEVVSGVKEFTVTADERGVGMIVWLQHANSSSPFEPCALPPNSYWQNSSVRCNDPGFLTTYVKICCKNCTSLGPDPDLYDCLPRLAPYRVQNFFSPNISFPLAVFLSDDPQGRSVFLKVHDYDGHMLKLFPLLCQLQRCNASVHYDHLDLFHDFDPPYGPVISFASSSTQGWSPVYAIPVSDYMWNNVEAWQLQTTPPAPTNGTLVTAAFSIFYQKSSPYIPYWRNWNTEVACDIQESTPCYADLTVYTLSQVDEMFVRAAPGFAPADNQGWWYDTTKRSANLSDCSDPLVAPYLPCGFCNLPHVSRLECRYYYTPHEQAVGENEVVCFMGETTRDGQSFIGSPYCVRFKVFGPSPTFIYTTKQDNFSYLSGYHFDTEFIFFPACVGRQTKENVTTSTAASNVLMHLYIEYPSMLASNKTQNSQCGRFSPYQFSAATSSVDPQFQLQDPTRDSSIFANLSSRFAYAPPPLSKDFSYTLNLTEGNGIFVDTVCNGSSFCPRIFLNNDIKIVAYSIDNSKTVYRRWVGSRPALRCRFFSSACIDSSSVAQHALGNYASLIQRWSFNLQAPPYFQLNEQGCIITLISQASTPPVALPCPDNSYAQEHRANPYQDRSIRLQLSATDAVAIELVARDPNPGDSVQIVSKVLGALPTRLSLSPTLCMPETANRNSCPSKSQACCSACLHGQEYCSCGGFSYQNSSFCPVNTTCNQAKLRIQYAPLPEDVDTVHTLCFYPRDSSSYCALQGIPAATSTGWSGNSLCLTISVKKTTHAWQSDWFDRYLLQNQLMDLYVGCVLSVRTAFLSSSPPSAGVLVQRSAEPSPLEQVGLVDVSSQPFTSPSSSWLDLHVTPRKGSEGSSLTLCVAAVDVNSMLLSSGACSDTLAACLQDSDCSQRCLQVCLRLQTHKCRYCVEHNVLSEVRVHLGIDVNWMRLWTLNDDTSVALGTRCTPFLDCKNDSGIQAVLDNPGLLPSPSQPGKFIVWVGLLNVLQRDWQAGALACFSRSSLAGMQRLNPDLGIANASSRLMAGANVCLAACEVSSSC